jgi:hypothetical protein
LPFQTKAQELRAKVLKQPALLNAWKGKNPTPLVYNVPVRATKEGSKVETFTMMFRQAFHIILISWRTQRSTKLEPSSAEATKGNTFLWSPE